MLVSPAVLTGLKYSGSFLASASAIWGTMHDLKEKDATGHSRLTSAGRASILLTLAGLLISACSTYVADRIDEEKAYETAIREQQRETQRRFESLAQDQRNALRMAQATQAIVIAGQPLSTINLTWDFEGLPAQTLAAIGNAERAASDFEESNEDLFRMLHGDLLNSARMIVHRHMVLYPTITMLASGTSSDAPSIILVPLNSGRSAVLPLGRLPFNSDTKGVSPTVEFNEEFRQWQLMTPLVARERTGREYSAHLGRHGSHVVLTWQISATAMVRSLDLLDSAAKPTAALPDTIELLIVHAIERWPASPSNFAAGYKEFTRGHGAFSSHAIHGTSMLDLQPNNLPYHVKYKMEYGGERTVDDSDAEMNTAYCNVVTWKGKRVAE